MKVFICYRRRDSQPFADRIYDWLERAFEPDNVFKDIDTIPLGRDFRRILEEAVARCDALLVVIGSRWLGETDESGRRRVDDPGDWVRIEIETALDRDIPVIPLLVDGASFPCAEDLPPSLQKLVYRHGTPVRPDPDFRHDMGRVIKALRDVPASRHPEKSAAVSEITTPSVREATLRHFRYAMGRMIKALREIVLRVSRPPPTEAARDDDRKPQSWWTTPPGILTAAAGIMTALIGLSVMLKQVGAFPRAPQPAPTMEALPSSKGQETFKAIAGYGKAIELDPKLAAAYNDRGNTWYVKREYSKAIADYDKAIELDPKLAAAYTNCDLARKAKQEDKAIADYDKAIELDPKDAKAYFSRGNTWYRWREYDKAIADYDKAIELDPTLAAAYLSRDDAREAKQGLPK